MKILKALLGLACGLVLTACNMVISDEPWLEARDDAPVLKPGVWATFEGDDCDFEGDIPVEFWPGCAEATVIGNDGSWYSRKEDSNEWEKITPVLAFDDPVVGQIELPKEIAMKEGGEALFLYFALIPEEQDSDGRITAMRSWLVQCGPQSTSGQNAFKTTDTPFEGITVHNDNCVAESVDALRNAAAKSADLQEGGKYGRWMHDIEEGFPGKLP